MVKPMPGLEAIRGFHDELTAIRRDLHANPELGLEEHRTAEIVAAKLDRVGHRGASRRRQDRRGRRAQARRGRQVDRPARRHGLPADGGADQPALSQPQARADARLRPRRPHHHAAGRRPLSGRARRRSRAPCISSSSRARRASAGRSPCWRTGCSRGFPATQVFALHNRPGQPVGTFAIGKGPQSAGGAFFDITITGRGAHGARPELSVDPVLVAATSSRRCSRSSRATSRRPTRRC